ncbi:MAG: RNA repair transcriptional activator RtcR [Myxococcota bacterium]
MSSRRRQKQVVAIGLLGTRLDAGAKTSRWERWRPSVSLTMQDDLIVHRYELLRQSRDANLANLVAEDIEQISPETHVRQRTIEFDDPWDFEQVFGALLDFAQAYPFDTDREEYLVHISTGTHVAQICLFLLIESRHFPARMIQTSPRRGDAPGTIAGWVRTIDLDLSRYDQIAARFQRELADQVSRLKSGIDTQNASFNHMIDRINQVAVASTAPILLTGPTGAGKSHLARRIYELKKARRMVEGPMVEVNCATLRGDGAMSALFGHKKGSFTGAQRDRAGLLKTAEGGLLFLDEIGELGLDEQAMLLRAIETGDFLPVGADREEHSDFQLIAGTNRELSQRVRDGEFRGDLLARINLWHFRLPGLADRREDIEPNLDYELDQFGAQTGRRITFSKEARQRFLTYATSPSAIWLGNFRDLSGAVQRMATLAPGGRISLDVVDEEIKRLSMDWRDAAPDTEDPGLLPRILSEDEIANLDRFDKVQLADVVTVCAAARSLSEAGRTLFSESRKQRKTKNDSDRLRKYLAKFNLTFQQIQDAIHS